MHMMHRRVKRNMKKGPSSQYVLTVDDVRDIVSDILDQRDEQLVESFTAVLNAQLQEQFRVFSKFNEDYISQKLSDRCAMRCTV